MRSRYLGSATAAYPASISAPPRHTVSFSQHTSRRYISAISRQVSLRNVRREAIDKIKKLQKEGLSEDQSKEAQVDLGWISGRSRGDLG